MIGFFILLPITLFCATMTIFCLRGVDWILISGVNTLPKEDRRKFKERHDMIAMNKFIGKRVFLPATILCLGFMPFFFFESHEWMQSAWFGAVIIAVVIAALVPVFSALPKILGSHFEKKTDRK
jgi:hypothetical protein